MAKESINHAYVMKPPENGAQIASRLLKTSMSWESDTPSSMGTETLVLGTLLNIPLCISSSDCSPVSLNKLMNISKCFPEFCERL